MKNLISYLQTRLDFSRRKTGADFSRQKNGPDSIKLKTKPDSTKLKTRPESSKWNPKPDSSKWNPKPDSFKLKLGQILSKLKSLLDYSRFTALLWIKLFEIFERIGISNRYHRAMSTLEDKTYPVRTLAARYLSPIKTLFLDLIFPPRCPICDSFVTVTTCICARCHQSLKPIQNTNRFCMKCGNMLAHEENRLCHDCKSRPHFFEMARSLYLYRDIAPSMYRFKYGGRKEYAQFYGREIALTYEPLIDRWKPDALIPIPIHYIRRQDRGYNQAAALAKEIGRTLNIPVKTHLLRRVKSTKPLKNLDLSGRQNNLKGAFKLCQNVVKCKTIILIDDIYTTGSTMDACAQLLKKAGAEKIYVLTIAGGAEITPE